MSVLNEPGKVFLARRGTSELTTTVLTAVELQDLVERMLRPSGRRLDVSAPFVDATEERRGPTLTECLSRPTPRTITSRPGCLNSRLPRSGT